MAMQQTLNDKVPGTPRLPLARHICAVKGMVIDLQMGGNSGGSTTSAGGVGAHAAAAALMAKRVAQYAGRDQQKTIALDTPKSGLNLPALTDVLLSLHRLKMQ